MLPTHLKFIYKASTLLSTSPLPVHTHSQQEKKNSMNTSLQGLHWKTCWNCNSSEAPGTVAPYSFLWLSQTYAATTVLYFSQAYNYLTEFCQQLNIHTEKQLSE